MDTLKHRNPLYRNAALILLEYQRIQSRDMNQEELVQLLKETFVYPDKIDVLFELYWVIKLMKNNTTNIQLQLMDGKNNLIAQWDDDKFLYKLYHDSGKAENLKFTVSIAEMN